jgi:hypothetical protein
MSRILSWILAAFVGFAVTTYDKAWAAPNAGEQACKDKGGEASPYPHGGFACCFKGDPKLTKFLSAVHGGAATKVCARCTGEVKNGNPVCTNQYFVQVVAPDGGSTDGNRPTLEDILERSDSLEFVTPK